MAFRIKAKEAVEDSLKRIATEQVDKAIAEIDDKKLSRDEAVHQVRKRCKKIRALLRLVRPALGNQFSAENRFFRDTAREVAGLRDALIQIETLDALVADAKERARIASVRKRLVAAYKRTARDQAAHHERLAHVRRRLGEARQRIADWTLDASDFEAVCGGLLKTYARGRKAMRRAYKTSDPKAFHQWRKRVKYHRYQLQLLRDSWPPVHRAFLKELKTLSDLLGDEHDLTVFHDALRDHPDDFGSGKAIQTLTRMIERRRAKLRAEAGPLGERIHAEAPKRLLQRQREYWAVWR